MRTSTRRVIASSRASLVEKFSAVSGLVSTETVNRGYRGLQNPSIQRRMASLVERFSAASELSPIWPLQRWLTEACGVNRVRVFRDGYFVSGKQQQQHFFFNPRSNPLLNRVFGDFVSKSKIGDGNASRSRTKMPFQRADERGRQAYCAMTIKINSNESVSSTRAIKYTNTQTPMFGKRSNRPIDN